MVLPVIVLLLFVIITLIQMRSSLPISLFTFRFRLISGLLMLVVVWLLDTAHGKVQFKYLLTGITLLSVYAAYVQYKKGIPKNN